MVAQALLAQRELLELRVELTSARAEHARALARLDQQVGGHDAMRIAPAEGSP